MKLFARITPLLDVSEQCEKESVIYLQNLIGNPEHPLWAIKSRFQNITNSLKYFILKLFLIFGVYGSNIFKYYYSVLDSVGKLADGMFQNTKPFCGSFTCNLIPNVLGIREILER